MSNFWADKLGVTQQPPPHVQPAGMPGVPSQQPGAWWQGSPVAAHVQQQVPPEAYQQAGSGGPGQRTMAQLKAMRADEMTQQDMEELALLELQLDKYNHSCPQCGSDNFLPQGTRVNNARMGTDKCFDCGASSSTLTQSPEPGVGGTGGKPGKATKQVGGGTGNYGQHHSQLPPNMIPRNA